MLTCPKCGYRVIRVVKTLTIIEKGQQKDIDLHECAKCGYQERETTEWEKQEQ